MVGVSDDNSSSSLCKPVLDEKIFDLGCLGPALAIIVLLACLERRKHFKLEYCNGYPGLLIPINFLCSRHNRFTIAATFGATAATCLELFFDGNGGIFFSGGPPWVKIFQGIISILVYGILFYPLFACMSTDHRLIGSLVGFLYVSVRFGFKVAIDFQCPEWDPEIGSSESLSNAYVDLLIIANLPTYLCHIFIVIRFAVLLYLECRKKWFRSTWESIERAQEIASKSEIAYVKQILGTVPRMRSENVKWYLKAIYLFYKPRPDFKFSTQFIATLLVAAVVVFEVAAAFVGLMDLLKKITLSSCSYSDDWSRCSTITDLVYGSFEAAFVVSALISAIMLLHFMMNHRDHVLQLYRGQRIFCQGVYVSPSKLVGTSLKFSGYQVAHSLTGYIVLGIILAFVCIFLAIIFKYMRLFLSAEMWNLYKETMISLLPTVGMVVSLVVFQLFLAHFVFRDRDFPNETITVDNRRLFSIMSYFFFFYNVIVGMFSCLMRILKATILGILFLSRIDRTSLMQGFQTWDKAFVAYLGFINVLVAHSHPVMLVFCQLLINGNKDRGLEESLPIFSLSTRRESDVESGHASDYTRENRIPRMTYRAANRWYVAVTLLRNPSLIKYRKQGGRIIQSSENLRSSDNDLMVLV